MKKILVLMVMMSSVGAARKIKHNYTSVKIILTSFFLFITLFAKADYWTQKASSPTNFLVGTFSFAIGSKGYVGGGYDTLGYCTDQFWEYDPLLDSWTQKANFGGGSRKFATACSILGKGYVGLGWTQLSYIKNDWWEYNPVTDTWIQKSNFEGGNRLYPVAFSVGNYGYVCCGYGYDTAYAYQCYNDLWKYDPAIDSWTQKTNFPGLPRNDAFAFSIVNKGYVGGGFDCIGTPYPDFWEYDPILDSWSQKATIPDSIWVDACCFSIGNYGYVGVGETLTVSSNFWEYNPVSNQWIQKATFPGIARDEAAFFSVGGKGYVGLGGQNSHPVFYDFYEYTPDSHTGVFEISNSDPTFHFSPNPASSYINIVYSVEHNATLTITNAYGIAVKQLTLYPYFKNRIVYVDDLAEGIYLVTLREGDRVSSKKVIVQR